MDLQRYIERRRRLAWLALFWERLWRALWPAAGVIGLFLALALLDVLPLLPGWAHGLALLFLLLAFAAAVYVGVKGLVLPSDAEAQRRLERASGIQHRPLTALGDDLASGDDATTRALWEAHRERVRRAVRRLRIGLPRPGLATYDPYAVRGAVFLLLVVGLVVGGSDGAGRLARAVAPDLSGAPATPASVDIWINPPAYTGAPPRQLPPQGSADAVQVPVGSTLLARVFGGRGKPQLLIDDNAHEFNAVDAMNHELRVDVAEGRLLRLVEGERETELARWPLSMVPDQPPEVAFAEPPSATERATLQLDYRATDDYGLATVAAEIRLAEGNGDEVLTLELPLGAAGAKEAAETSFHDLTPHPWAGMEVRLRLAATDGVGQQGYSEEIRLTLPERLFHHPVARALIEQRKILTLDPDRRRAVALALSAIATGPETFDHDMVAYLAMQIAANRLQRSRADTAVPEVQNLLWDTALRIEDGGLSIAERDLRDAQQALMDALARNADDAEIERLADELQQALQRYLQAMAEEMQKRAERGEQPQPVDPNARMLDSQQLQDMVDRARELSRLGAKDAAREMLRQLQAMLENLRMGPMMATPEMQSGEQAMRDLSEMMQRQQELLDRTFRQTPRNGPLDQRQFGQQGRPQQGQQGQRGQQQGQQGGEPSDSMSGMAGEQEALRQQLAEMLRRLREGMGEAPQALDRAEGAMGEARDSLRQGQGGEAADAQTRAIDQMAEGLRSLADQMAQQMGQGQGQGQQGQMQDQGYRREDPLGRPLPNGGMDTSRVKIPEESDLQRARDILQELHRRSGDRRRPEVEHDYIERLLDRF